MPNIRTADVGPLGLTPSETGVESLAAAARRGGAFFNQAAEALSSTGQKLGQAVREAGDAALAYQQHREVSAGAASGAGMVASLNEDWNTTAKNADPNDPSVAAKWREETLQPALDKFKENFQTEGGQQWAEHFTDQFREHAVNKTMADMSSMAADAVHVNVLKTVNSLSSATFNDPSSLDFARGQFAHSLDGILAANPNISATDAAKVKNDLTLKGEEALVKSAITGAIVKGGDWQHIANDPKNAPYVNAAELKQFEQQQKTYQRMGQAEDRNARVMRDYVAKTDFNRAADDLELKTLPQTAGDRPTLPQDYWDSVRKMGTMPGAALEPGRLKSMVENGERLTARLNKAEPTVTDQAVKGDLTARMFDSANPTTPADIIKNSDHLSDHDYTRLIQSVKLVKDEALQDPIFKETMKGAQQLIEGRSAGEKMMAAGKYASFVQDFMPQYLAAKRAGTLKPDDLDTKNPESMISKAMKPYASPMADVIRANGGVGSQAPLPTYTAPKPPAANEVRQGYRFKGGDPSKPENWAKVQ